MFNSEQEEVLYQSEFLQSHMELWEYWVGPAGSDEGEE